MDGTKTIAIRNSKLMELNDLLRACAQKANATRYKDAEREAVFSKGVEFSDGRRMEIRVWMARREVKGLPYSFFADAVLVDGSGNELDKSDAQFELDGAYWAMYYGGDCYKVQVIGADEVAE